MPDFMPTAKYVQTMREQFPRKAKQIDNPQLLTRQIDLTLAFYSGLCNGRGEKMDTEFIEFLKGFAPNS
jgi:hypothetical protein